MTRSRIALLAVAALAVVAGILWFPKSEAPSPPPPTPDAQPRDVTLAPTPAPVVVKDALPDDLDGMLVVHVVDAETGSNVAGATVAFRWMSLSAPPPSTDRARGAWDRSASAAEAAAHPMDSGCASALASATGDKPASPTTNSEGLLALPRPPVPETRSVLILTTQHGDYPLAVTRVGAEPALPPRVRVELSPWTQLVAHVVAGKDFSPPPAPGIRFRFSDDDGLPRFEGRMADDRTVKIRKGNVPLWIRCCDARWAVSTQSRRLAGGATEAHIELLPVPIVTVREAGSKEPVTRLSLVVQTNDGPAVAGTFSAPDGRYPLTWGGIAAAAIRNCRIQVTAPGYRPVERTIERLGATDNVEMFIETSPSSGLSLRVHDDGAPVANARVAVARTDATGPWKLDALSVLAVARTDAAGNARLAVVPGKHVLVIDKLPGVTDVLTRPLVVSGDAQAVDIDVNQRGTLVAKMTTGSGGPVPRGTAVVTEIDTGRRVLLVGDAEGRARLTVSSGRTYAIAEALSPSNKPGTRVTEETLEAGETRTVVVVLRSRDRVIQPRLMAVVPEGENVRYRAADRGSWHPLPASGVVDQSLVRGRTFELRTDDVRVLVAAPMHAETDTVVRWPTDGPGLDVGFAAGSTAPEWVWARELEDPNDETAASFGFRVESDGVARVRSLDPAKRYVLDFESTQAQFPYLYHVGVAAASPAPRIDIRFPNQFVASKDFVAMRGRVLTRATQAPISKAQVMLREITPTDALGGRFHVLSPQAIDYQTGDDGGFSVKLRKAPKYEALVLVPRLGSSGYQVTRIILDGFRPERDLVVP